MLRRELCSWVNVVKGGKLNQDWIQEEICWRDVRVGAERQVWIWVERSLNRGRKEKMGWEAEG